MVCDNAKISLTVSEKDKARLELLLNEHGQFRKLLRHDDTKAILFDGFRCYLSAKEQIEAKKREEELKSIRASEQEEKSKLLHYWEYSGREKRIAMLQDELNKMIEAQKDLESVMVALPAMMQQKEHDTAILGGIASGIAGPAMGLATMINTEQKNAEIRVQNEAVKQAFSRDYMKFVQASSKRQEAIDELRSKVWKTKTKLVSDVSPETAFEYLTVKRVSSSVTESGAVYVEATIRPNKQAVIYDDVPAVVDGFLVAKLQNKTNNGTGKAYLQLPVQGADTEMTLKGICTKTTDANADYNVEIRPHMLWLIEI